MKLPTYIARRFMLGGRGAGASRFTGWIAIIGMAAGCLALIISVAVLNGFEERVAQKIVGFEGDLRLSDFNDLHVVKNIVDEQSETKLSMPFLERKGVLLTSLDELRMVTFKAVDFQYIAGFYNLGIDITSLQTTEIPIVVGRILADRLNLAVSEKVKLLSPIDSPIQLGIPRQITAQVAAIFQAEVLDYDDRLVFIPLAAGQKLFTRKQGFDGLDIRLISSGLDVDVKSKLSELLPAGIRIESWADLHQGLFQAMKMERIGTVIILSLIILVASFNLTSTLVLVTYQKIREIGILRTLGASVKVIHSIILRQGLMIGSAGAITGILLGVLIVLTQNYFGFLPLPEDIYFINQVPMKLLISDIFLIPLIAFILIIFASVLAAHRTIRIQPKEAVHLEK